MVAGRGIYPEAWLLVALGFAVRMAPVLERHPAARGDWLVRSVPILLGLVLLPAGWIWRVDRIKQWREDGRPLPPAGSPNVLLIVLDTVRADHLSLYGYPRPTTPNLERLAQRGIRFDRARAAAPWTLASHANMFTGRWPHELAIEWIVPAAGGRSDAGRIPGIARLCDGRIRRQHASTARMTAASIAASPITRITFSTSSVRFGRSACSTSR